MAAKTINIVALVDVVGALASDTLDQNIYLIDNNKENGSSGEGTEILKTVVEDGDTIIWNIAPIEPEAYASIADIQIDNNFCETEEKRFEESDITYWSGKVRGDSKEKYVYYKLKIKLGIHEKELVTENSPCLVFSTTHEAITTTD